MSEITNRKRLNPNATPLKKFLLALMWYPFGFLPGLVLLYMALRVRPVKGKWLIYSLIGIAVSVLFLTLNVMMKDDIYILYNLLSGILLVIYIYKTRAYEEYVMRYNALVDSGYFVEKERIKAANLQRWEDETAMDALHSAQSLTYRPKGVAVPRPDATEAEDDILEESGEVVAHTKTESMPADDKPEATPADDGWAPPAPGSRKLDL
ncbi:MAG: hypothetical protein IKK08_06160 [Clostridia bacterium]|nr:hypothetical protein [Clostridia bacterium]